MEVSVFGLGYVGTVTSACLAKLGHTVTGVDINEFKVDCIAKGKSPIAETGLEDLISEMQAAGRLGATSSAEEVIRSTTVSLICVGTPSYENGSIDLGFVERVCRDIGKALGGVNHFHVVMIRSTMLPGTMEDKLVPALEESSGKKVGVDFGVCYNPEFLREGSAVSDFFNPPFTLLGATDDRTLRAAQEVFSSLSAPVFTTSPRVAEMVKYVANSFHALKVVFANEIGNLCKKEGIDSHEVMRIFCKDKRLSISEHYLEPGFAFGGSCLPKDVRALCARFRETKTVAPVLESILSSNQNQIRVAQKMIEETRKKKIGILGISFKAGTDDLRESPIVSVIESLVGKGYSVKVFDENVDLSRLLGANRQFVQEEVPYLPSIMCFSMDELLDFAEVVVIANKGTGFKDVGGKLRKDQVAIDLVRIMEDASDTAGTYKGICW
ncbi:MAG: nucleotide sugar dehydrogenase [Candidatus Eiseniibacteriota bacterium]|nr:MAG: nucleotide sugar dehydrogenase [Candidatus Eisenbacteria bacterium]